MTIALLQDPAHLLLHCCSQFPPEPQAAPGWQQQRRQAASSSSPAAGSRGSWAHNTSQKLQ